MLPKKGKGSTLWIASVLMLALVALTSCVKIEVVNATPAASTPQPFASASAPESQQHNLAILAVDFSPPLNYQQLIVRPQSVELLVAIENTGHSTERNVTARAELSTPEDPELFLTQGASMASIAPGEVQVVRFGHLGEIPYHQKYRLEVMVDPVDGESELGNNRKAFDIQIQQELGTP